MGLTPFLRCNPKETRKLYGYGSVPFTKRSAVQKGIHTHVHNAPLHSRKLSDILLVAQAGTLHIAERRLLSTNTPSTHQASVVNQYHSGIASKINSRSSSRSDTDPLSVNSHMDRRPVLNILGRAPRQWPEFLPFLPNSIATFIYRKTIYAEFKTLVNCASTWSMLITITAFLAMPSEDKSKYDLELPLELIESAGGQGRKELWPLIYRMASLWAYRDQKWLSLSEQYYLMRINLNRIQDFYKSKQPRCKTLSFECSLSLSFLAQPLENTKIIFPKRTLITDIFAEIPYLHPYISSTLMSFSSRLTRDIKLLLSVDSVGHGDLTPS